MTADDVPFTSSQRRRTAKSDNLHGVLFATADKNEASSPMILPW
jgi:hypothetical protein